MILSKVKCTQADIDNESAVVKKLLAHRADMKAIKMPDKYGVDFAVIGPSGYIDSYVEIKCRNIESTKYKKYTIALSKLWSALRLLPTPTYLAVRWTDGIGYVKMRKEWKDYPIHMTGIMDEDNCTEGEDVREPMIYIPIQEFCFLT